MTTSIRILASALALTLVGCGGDSHGGGGGGATDLEDVPAAYAGVICDGFETCGGEIIDLFLGSGFDCRAEFTSGAEDTALEQWRTAIAAGTVTYDGAAMTDCIEAVRALGCDLFANRLPAVCEDALEGTVPLGSACNIDAECAGPAYCTSIEEAMCPGTCAARVGSGMPCSRSEGCESGLTCESGSCQAPVAEGGACEGDTMRACEFGLACIGSDGATPGTCRDPATLFTAADGATCNPMGGPLCTGDLSCTVETLGAGGVTFQCSPPVTSGAACRPGIPDPCPDDEYCADIDPMMGDIDGTCTALPTAGTACAAVLFGARCATGLRCDDSGAMDLCVTVSRLGGSCASNTGCHSGLCEAGVCVTPTCNGGGDI